MERGRRQVVGSESEKRESKTFRRERGINERIERIK